MYGCDSRADHANAARTVPLSVAAVALLGFAAAEEVPFKEKMRAYGRAVAMNRSADLSERAMMQRRHYFAAHPPAAHSPAERSPAAEPSAAPLPPGPVPVAANAAAHAAIEAAVAEVISTYCKTDALAKAKTVALDAIVAPTLTAEATMAIAAETLPATETVAATQSPAATVTQEPSTAFSLPAKPSHTMLPHVESLVAAICHNVQVPEVDRHLVTSMSQELLRTVATMPPPVAPNASLSLNGHAASGRNLCFVALRGLPLLPSKNPWPDAHCKEQWPVAAPKCRYMNRLVKLVPECFAMLKHEPTAYWRNLTYPWMPAANLLNKHCPA